jgi:hypothetical protein
MRKYNRIEKDFLKLLVKINNEDAEFLSYFLQKYYFTKQKNSALIVLTVQRETLLYIKKEIFDDLSKRKKELIKFINILHLIDYLKDNRLISILENQQAHAINAHFMYEDFNQPKLQNNNLQLNSQGLYIDISDPSKIYDQNQRIIFEAIKLDNNIYDSIMNNFFGLLFVSEDLKEYVNNDFKSTEDLKYKKAQIATWVSIFIAFSFGLLGLYNPFEKNEIKEYKLDKQQFETIIKQSKMINANSIKIIHKKFQPKSNKIVETKKNCVHNKNMRL